MQQSYKELNNIIIALRELLENRLNNIRKPIKMCCKALTPNCMACSQDISIQHYCNNIKNFKSGEYIRGPTCSCEYYRDNDPTDKSVEEVLAYFKKALGNMNIVLIKVNYYDENIDFNNYINNTNTIFIFYRTHIYFEYDENYNTYPIDVDLVIKVFIHTYDLGLLCYQDFVKEVKRIRNDNERLSISA